ncbi:hypothetical protein FZD47_20380 [Bacillus infantis]|uniref:YqaJ viral recombinase domain-containing protein n=1 Tax=Bacillus infantis TaxID=324767 RepID=A0A5D4SBB1_9BACI|nr:YqaJ viral recombinase family protein [Bacillus infantis]TYS60570.1 hypothetical protein FZD47_20380 [Bacillus infantis]
MSKKILVWHKRKYDKYWLNFRKQGIGGSDVSAIFGVDKWKSATDVFLEKTGNLQSIEAMEELPLRLRLKDFIAKEFAWRSGFNLIRRNAILKHPKYPFMIGTIDRLILNENAGLMCKSVAEYAKDEWSNGNVPYRYLLQCQHYMAITNAEKWWIALLIGGNKFKYFSIKRDNDLINKIIEKEKYFWNEYVLKRFPPPFDGSYGTRNTLNRLYPTATEESLLQLPGEALLWIEKFKAAELAEKQANRNKMEAEHNIKALIGSNEMATIDRYKIEWRNIRGKDRKNHRRFSIKQVDQKL